MAEQQIPQATGDVIGEENPTYWGGAFDGVENDGNATGSWYAWDGAYKSTGWTGKDYGEGEAKILTRVDVLMYNTLTRPKNFTIEGQEDGSATWDVLHTETDYAYVSGWQTINISNTTGYRKIRFNVSANGGSQYLVVMELKFYEDPDLAPTSTIMSSLVQYYGAGPVQQELEQVYWLLDFVQASLDQGYDIYAPIQSVLEQPWGIRLLGQLVQHYGNAPVIQSALWQWYGDTSDVQSWISQRWGDAHQAQSVLEQMYNLPQALQSVLEQRYAIAGTEVLSYIEQMYNLHGFDAVRAALVQPWMIAAAESLRAAVSATVTIGGTAVDPYHITVEWSADLYALSGELHFADQGTWLGIAEGDAATVACAGQTATMIVAGKRRSRRVGQTVYIVELASAAILLDEPYALSLLERWDGVLASTVAQELADYASITVDWQIIDDYVYDLYANNETPLAVLRKLAGEWGGVLRCELDGTLSVVYDYPYPPAPAPGDTWETVSPAATLTDQDNFFTAEESLDRRPGYNRYLVGNQDAATAGERLEEETVSASRKYLRGYVVPWADQALYSLATSKDGVAIQPVSVPAADYLIEEELVEFVNGGGRTSYPVHAITSYTWQDDQLGAITHSEDGTLTAEVEGNSLLLLTYETRFLMWQADYPQIADVQFILERTE